MSLPRTACHPAPGIGLGAIALALCLSLSGGAGAQDEPPPPHLVSEIKDLRFSTLRKLPAAPSPHNRGDDCPALAVQPRSEAARAVAAQGWCVTGDAPLGRYRAVSFASDLESATSGTCFVHDGNVGLFEDSRLVALVYGRGGDDAVGSVTAQDDGGVRVSDGDIARAPVGDLSVQADGTLLLSRLPVEETVCGGRGTVPAIRRLPIDKARAALMAKGWTPVRGEPSTDPREQALVRRGVVEVRTCSGTGLADCEFGYTGPAGTLSVTTQGDADMPEVSDHDVRCR